MNENKFSKTNGENNGSRESSWVNVIVRKAAQLHRGNRSTMEAQREGLIEHPPHIKKSLETAQLLFDEMRATPRPRHLLTDLEATKASIVDSMQGNINVGGKVDFEVDENESLIVTLSFPEHKGDRGTRVVIEKEEDPDRPGQALYDDMKFILDFDRQNGW